MATENVTVAKIEATVRLTEAALNKLNIEGKPAQGATEAGVLVGEIYKEAYKAIEAAYQGK